MYEKEKIDSLALMSKSLLDITPISEEEKNDIKCIIEQTAAFLKVAISTQNAHISQIRAAAQHYGLDRIAVFPCLIQGKIQTGFRMHGGDIRSFCREMGIQVLSDDDESIVASDLWKMEQSYSVVMYER